MNKSLLDVGDPRRYKAITIAPLDDLGAWPRSKVVMLENGTRAEYWVLNSLCEFAQKNPSREPGDPMYCVNLLLKEKGFRPTLVECARAGELKVCGTVILHSGPEKVPATLNSLDTLVTISGAGQIVE